MPRYKRLKKKSQKETATGVQEDDLELDDLDLDDLALDLDDVEDVPAKKVALAKKSAQKKADSLPETETVKAKPALIEKSFDSEEQALLSQNEHMRFMNASSTVAHALVTKNKDGRIIAQQFAAPGSTNPEDPRVTQLRDIEIFKDPFGTRRARAKAVDGTEMVSKRSVNIETTDARGEHIQHELLLFSPRASHVWRGDVFWGSNPESKPPLFRKNLSEAEKKELEKEIKEAKATKKGGELDIVHQDVPFRENQVRKPTQNDVMGQSAIDAYKEYYEQYEDELSDEMKAIFEKSEAARPHVRNPGIKSQPRPEWCHALGHGLTPLSQDPQHADNLAAAPKWVNTKMMTTERALKWHALNRPHSELHLSCQFNVLPHSDIMDDGNIRGTIKENGHEVQISQYLNPHQKYPVYSKPTDIMQTTLVAHRLLNGEVPLQTTEARIEPRMQQDYHIVTQPGGYGLALEEKASTQSPVIAAQTHQDSVAAPPVPALSLASASAAASTPTPVLASASASAATTTTINQLTVTNNADLNTVTCALPTSYLHQDSVVKVYSTFQQPDFEMPWLGSTPFKCTGSGFVYQDQGKHYVITNAHVVEDANFLEIQIANDDRKFIAKPKQISYQADIALLEVEDPEFKLLTKPVALGDMVQIQDEVKVVGFPMGGEELSITKGIVSRIEVDTYAESGERMLQVQTDSAINPGNSGGPVFSGNKVVGIAFQGIDGGQNLGYFIPMPVLKHFLEDAFSNDAYKGYPTLNIAVQPLSNSALREYFGLKKGESGVRVNTIDALSDAYGKLQKDDIILTIDGIKIGNDAKVTVPEVGNRLDLNYLFHRKHVGEAIQIDVLRRNQASGEIQRLSIPVTLKWRPGQTKKVEAPEHEKDPTYYINSGVVFQPLTNNYLETRKGSALADVVIPQVGYITDIPKQQLGEQFVIINQVLDCELTSGYGDFENGIVSEINGQKINNIQDVVKAMEGNPSPYHRIQCVDGDLIVIKNFQPEQNQKLLKQYRIHHDRSEDLKPLVAEVDSRFQSQLVEKVSKETLERASKSDKKSDSRSDRKTQDKADKLLLERIQRLEQYIAAQQHGADDQEGDDSEDLEDIPGLDAESEYSDDESPSENDLFKQGDAEDESDYDYEDGFLVRSDDEEADVQDEVIPDELLVPQASLLHLAKKSGRSFTMGELGFMDTVDRLAQKYGKSVPQQREASSDENIEVASSSKEKSAKEKSVRVKSRSKLSAADRKDGSKTVETSESIPPITDSSACVRRSKRLQGLRP